MAATPAKAGPTRRTVCLDFPQWRLPAIGLVAAAGSTVISLLFLASSRFSRSGAGISSSLFVHLFLLGILGLAGGALVIWRSVRLGVAMVVPTPRASGLPTRPVSPPCRSRSPPSLSPLARARLTRKRPPD